MKQLFKLFIIFARIGAFTFGGGYAMLPILQEEIVEKRGWATNEEMLDYYAIGQSTPGIIAVNTATFIGYKQKGIIGGIVATLGMVFPSIVIITLIASVFTNFQNYPVVQHAFGGIRVCVVALITNSVVKMWKSSVKDRTGIIIFALSSLIVAFMDVSPVFIVLGSAILGIIMKYKRMNA